MKTKLFFTFLLLGMTFSSCTEEVLENTNTRNRLSIEVADVNSLKATTRAVYSDLATTFENNDQIGLYVVKGSGSGARMVNANICYTYNSSTSEWTTTSDVEYNSGYYYYAYYPYRSDHGYTPAYTAMGADNIFDAFINDDSNKFHETNQSTKENFQKSDFMLATGSDTGVANTVSFEMTHKKGLAKFTGGAANATWTGNIPYKPGNTCAYFLMKPSTTTEFTDEEATYTLNASSGKYLTRNVRASRTLSFTTAPTEVVVGSTVTVAVTPSLGVGDGSITYSASPTSVGTVNSSTGVVTGVSPGNVTITANISQGTNYLAASKTHTLTVKDNNVVDLGLPSGTKWAKGNIVSDGKGGYKVGSETDYGAYFSWGNVTPHFSSNGSTFDDGYNWGTSNGGSPYAGSAGSTVAFSSQHKGRDYSANATYDAARACLGGSWQVPTATQFQELFDNTDNEWTTISGVNGRKFMKKTDHSVYVFFPAAGFGYSTSLSGRGSYGHYWSSSLYSAVIGYLLGFNSSGVNPQNYSNRYYGFSVRAVQ